MFGGSVDGRYFQKHMHDLFMAWVNNGRSTAGFASLTDSASVNFAQNGQGWTYGMRAKQQTVQTRLGIQTRLNSTIEMTAPGGAFGFAVGSGDGAAIMNRDSAMQLSSDFDPNTGGVEPLLGFASGQSHMAVRAKLTPSMRISVGFTNAMRDIEDELAGASSASFDQQRLIGDFEASAANVRVDHALTPKMNVGVSFTQLSEARSLFGTRSLARDDFGNGTTSRSATVSADAVLFDKLQLFGSATVASSRSDKDANFRIGKMTSTAWQLGLAGNGLLHARDHLRLSIAQPLTVESGTVDFQTVGVVDRETGEKGIITQQMDISEPASRRFRIEGHYGLTMPSDAAQLSLFSSYEVRDIRSDIARWTIGGKFRLSL